MLAQLNVMKILLPLLLLTLVTFTGKTQIISSFNWNANPVTKSAVGPDAISVYATATSAPNGTNGNGLNAGPDRQNINLVLPGSNFNVSGIDISIDFRREESEADFYTRSNFVFGMAGGKLRASFPLVNGAGFTAIASGNIRDVANDHLFHSYRFRYDQNMGTAVISVDGTVVYTYNGTAGTALYWTGAGNVTVGANADGAASSITIFDNLLVQAIPAAAVLPLKLVSFTAAPKGSYATINWSTTQEVDVSGFVIERSIDGTNFYPVKTVKAVNSFNSTNKYHSTDSTPLKPYGYYRLKMLDLDGSYTYSTIKKVDISAADITVSCFPNPSTDYVNLRITSDKAATYTYTVSSLDGKAVLSATTRLNSGAQLISIDLTRTNIKGILLVQLHNASDNTGQTFKIVKQ